MIRFRADDGTTVEIRTYDRGHGATSLLVAHDRDGRYLGESADPDALFASLRRNAGTDPATFRPVRSTS